MANPAPKRTGKNASRPPIDEVAVERERDARVVAHVRVGKGFDEIAQIEGFADRSGAWRSFWRVVNRNEAREVDQMRAVQREQAEAVLAVFMPRLLDGEATALAPVRVAWERLAKLYGMDAPARMVADVMHGLPEDPTEQTAVLLDLQAKLTERLASGDGG